jgi:membrane protease YdiL (CAAX protease family)
MFGLIHGNLYQFFYAFLLGVAFSYIYIRSGKIIYSTLLHMFVNLFCGVFPAYILTMFNYEEFLQLMAEGKVTEEYINANMLPLILLMAYEFIMLAMVGVGVYHFTKNLRNIRINKGKVRFSKGMGAEIMFFNIGTILLIAYCVIMIAVNTFTV